MYDFLKQFTAQQSWTVNEEDLIYNQHLSRALVDGLVAYYKHTHKCTYYPSIFCTLKGRLYLRKQTK